MITIHWPVSSRRLHFSIMQSNEWIGGIFLSLFKSLSFCFYVFISLAKFTVIQKYSKIFLLFSSFLKVIKLCLASYKEIKKSTNFINIQTWAFVGTLIFCLKITIFLVYLFIETQKSMDTHRVCHWLCCTHELNLRQREMYSYIPYFQLKNITPLKKIIALHMKWPNKSFS